MIKERVCHYLPGDIEEGDIMKKVTNGNMGAEGGLKFGIFEEKWIFNGLSGVQLYLLKADQPRARAILTIFLTSSLSEKIGGWWGWKLTQLQRKKAA